MQKAKKVIVHEARHVLAGNKSPLLQELAEKFSIDLVGLTLMSIDGRDCEGLPRLFHDSLDDLVLWKKFGEPKKEER